jgi:hypothetical protein
MNNQIKLTADQVNEFSNFMAGKALTHIVDQNGIYRITQQTVDRAIEWVMSNHFQRIVDEIHGVSDINEKKGISKYDYTGTQYELRYHIQDILHGHVKNLINIAVSQITSGKSVVEIGIGTDEVQVRNVHDLQRYPRMNPDLRSCITS